MIRLILSVILGARGAGNLEADVDVQNSRERRGMPGGGPELQIRVPGGLEPEGQPFVRPLGAQTADNLGMAAVQAFHQADDAAEQFNRPALSAAKGAKRLVRSPWGRLAVIPRHERDDLHFLGVEPAEAPVPNEVVRVFVMALVTDVGADVVEQRAVLEPLALAFA